MSRAKEKTLLSNLGLSQCQKPRQLLLSWVHQELPAPGHPESHCWWLCPSPWLSHGSAHRIFLWHEGVWAVSGAWLDTPKGQRG